MEETAEDQEVEAILGETLMETMEEALEEGEIWEETQEMKTGGAIALLEKNLMSLIETELKWKVS